MHEILRQLIELIRPDLRHYYRIVKKARIVKAYASDGKYWADVQPLRNDGSADESEPIVPQAELPVIWSGDQRGIVCPPKAGTVCDLSYYDGDPNYPVISNLRWEGVNAPAAGLDELVIQHSPGIKVWFDSAGKWHIETPQVEIITGQLHIQAATSHEGNINLEGNLFVSGAISQLAGSGGAKGASMTGSLSISGGNLSVNGNITATGTITDGQGGTTR
jgi:hypothetical protein